METLFLDGRALRGMLIGAAKNLKENVDYINDLNVFPVPDGDTGTNMTKTIEGGIAEMMSNSENDKLNVSTVISKFAHGALLGARGNSGVILSQIFAGISEVLSGCEMARVSDLCKAYLRGVEKAYNSVTNPVEGTILTVFREAAEYAASNLSENSYVEDFLSLHIKEAKNSLLRTKDILPALKEADVVDSGGAGYLFIASGMYSALTGEEVYDTYEFLESSPTTAVNIDAFTRDSVLEFGYCTELLLRLQTAKVDPDTFDVGELISYLESIGGESIVSYKTGDVVKVHVHTENPGFVLTKAREYGELLTVKIENMSLQHNDTEVEKNKREHVPMAVVTVATGEGMSELFTTIGADKIISGGQTQNPSAEDFIKAFEEVNADDIIVLPNNKNIFLTAVHASSMWDEDRVHIIPTKTLMQGYAALSMISHDGDVEGAIESANEAIENVIDVEITYAVRDAIVGGTNIKKGEYMAISNSSIKATASTPEEALLTMLEGLDELDEREVISVFVGCDVTEAKRVELTETLTERYPDHEIMFYNGGQAVYSYLIAIE